ncbi:hypothetical protein MK338_10635, partial [Streptococcus vestibularis]|nr:hypothetical protein [Streptococcus vestibularis]
VEAMCENTERPV